MSDGMERTIRLRLNGEPRQLTARADATLLEVLRDGCGLHGVRE
ncbi:MAG: (2Fe-2S)-binding protein, partial [Thermomicrobiaceae bacterium]|nr:(2Fe-2S)-binding protein [Thermomicrobiaceae bacterium]